MLFVKARQVLNVNQVTHFVVVQDFEHFNINNFFRSHLLVFLICVRIWISNYKVFLGDPGLIIVITRGGTVRYILLHLFSFIFTLNVHVGIIRLAAADYVHKAHLD